MDISTQAVAPTAPLHLKDATGDLMYNEKKEPLRLILFGPASTEYGEVEARRTNRALRRMQENGGKMVAATPDQARADRAEDLAALTSGIEGFTYAAAGDKVGRELFSALYLDKGLGFIAEQAAGAVENWGKFKVASATK